MIDREHRQAILLLHAKGMGSRRIARAVRVSRTSVIGILREEGLEAEPQEGELSLTPHLSRIRKLYTGCEGNLVLVAEELSRELEKPIPYSTLTRFCRHHRLGQAAQPAEPAGEYAFAMGEEMQHDTSPIELAVGGTKRIYQAASLKLGWSRMRYLRFYRHFTRFECKDFLTRAFEFFGGVCARCVIDNTSVIVASGTGKRAVIAPELESFRLRFGFRFLAHELGDADRKAKVERDFRFIQQNLVKLLSLRPAPNDHALNERALAWVRKKNAKDNRRLRATPEQRFEEERAHLGKLPDYIPPVYELHDRTVSVEGLVTLKGNEYSAPACVLGKLITLRETMETVTLLDGKKELCTHPRLPDGERGLSRLPEHGRRVRRREARSLELPEEQWLRHQIAPIPGYLDGLRRSRPRVYSHQLRRLYRLCHEYSADTVAHMARKAMTYELYDAARLETMLLQELGARLFGPSDWADPRGVGCVTPSRSDPESPDQKSEQPEKETDNDDNT